MNEILIKELIKHKINLIDKIINHLPSDTAEEIKSLGDIVIDGINEGYKELKEKPPQKSSKSNNLKNISID